MRRKKGNIRIKLTPRQKETVYAQPLSQQFHIAHIDSESGFSVYQHVLVDDIAKDYKQVLAVARAYAKECDCWINPVVDKNAVGARARIFPGIADNANPDLTTRKYGYIDVKSPFNKGNIIKNANSASKQSAIVVITDLNLQESLKHKRVIQFTMQIFSDCNKNHRGQINYTQDQIHWFLNGQLLKYNRPEKKISFPA